MFSFEDYLPPWKVSILAGDANMYYTTNFTQALDEDGEEIVDDVRNH